MLLINKHSSYSSGGDSIFLTENDQEVWMADDTSSAQPHLSATLHKEFEQSEDDFYLWYWRGRGHAEKHATARWISLKQGCTTLFKKLMQIIR